MQGCTRILAVTCLLLFIISGAAGLLIINVRWSLLSPDLFTEALEESDFFQALPSIVADQLSSSTPFNTCVDDATQCGEDGLPSDFANLSDQAMQEVITSLIDPAWLSEQTGSALGQAFSMILGDSEETSIEISLSGVQDELSGDQGLHAIRELVFSQPPCTSDQLMQLTQPTAVESMGDAILECAPPQEIWAQIEPQIQSGLKEVALGLPGTLEIDAPTSLAGDAPMLSLLRIAFKYGPWTAVFWLLAVTFLAVRDFRSWLGWWGFGFFSTGFIAFLIALGLPLLTGVGFERFLPEVAIGGITPGLLDSGIGVVDHVISAFSGRIQAQAGVILGIGLLMLVIRLFTRPRSSGQIGTQLTQPRSTS